MNARIRTLKADIAVDLQAILTPWPATRFLSFLDSLLRDEG